MRNSRLVAVVSVGALVMVATGAALRSADAASEAERRREVATLRVHEERDAAARATAFYLGVARADPTSSLAHAKVATLHLQRARASGDHAALLGAEEAARRSLSFVPGGEEALLTLTASLVAQHRFREALDEARRLLATDPRNGAHRALVAEILLELGDYAGARPIFDSLSASEVTMAVAPRISRWLELTGRADQARRILRGAGVQALRLDHLPREQIAWYYLRMGDLEWRDGRLDRAVRAYTEGLDVVPDDHRLLAALARVELGRRRWDQAIARAEESIAVVLDPAPIAVLASAHRALGDTSRAAEYDATLDLIALHQPGPFHRALSLYWLDQGRHVPEVLRRAEEELRTRPDPHGHDVVAWALYRSGRTTEARDHMRRALVHGAVDATLYFHAGMIERAIGDADAARRHLERALEVNPYFHPTHPAAARAVLDSLGDASR